MIPALQCAVRAGRTTSRGAVTIEFALVCILALMLVFSVIEVGRLMWIWNMGAHAVREGARTAALCQPGADTVALVKQRVADASLGTFPVSAVAVEYQDPVDHIDPCSAETCKSVQVTLSGVPFRSVVPFVPVSVTLPPFVASSRREVMAASCS